MTDNDPLIGTRVAGRYVVERRLGQGGMGAIYVARQVPLERHVVLKVLLDALADDAVSVARFEKEALAVSRLLHPHIVTLFDFGRMERGGLFIAMEYLHGRTLRQVLHVEGRLDWQRTLPIVEGIARGLDEAHRHGIVHRDLKPENIMLVPTGDHDDFPKVLDFGLARTLDATGDDEQKLTQQNMIPGTPAYLAPERVNAIADDHRGDLYSLGALWFELLVGRPPFEDPSPIKLIVKQMMEPLPRMHERAPGVHVPAPIEGLVRRLLEKRPEERPQSALDVVREVKRLASSESWAVASLGNLTFSDEHGAEQDERHPEGHRGEISFADLAVLDDERALDETPLLLTRAKPIALTQRKATRASSAAPPASPAPLESSETSLPSRGGAVVSAPPARVHALQVDETTMTSARATSATDEDDGVDAALAQIARATDEEAIMQATVSFLARRFDRALVLDWRGARMRVLASHAIRAIDDPHAVFSSTPDFVALASQKAPYIGPRREGAAWRLLHHTLSAGLPERVLVASLRRDGRPAFVLYAELDQKTTRLDIAALARVVDAAALALARVGG